MRVEITYKLVTRVIEYFCFLNKPMKGGTSWISRKGEIIEKGGGVDLEKGGGMTPLTNYVTEDVFLGSLYNLESSDKVFLLTDMLFYRYFSCFQDFEVLKSSYI